MGKNLKIASNWRGPKIVPLNLSHGILAEKNLSSFTTPTKPTLRRNVSGTHKNLTAKLGYLCRLRRIEGDPTKIHSTSRMGFLHKQFMPKIELAELETSKFHIQKLATPRLASVMPIAPNWRRPKIPPLNLYDMILLQTEIVQRIKLAGLITSSVSRRPPQLLRKCDEVIHIPSQNLHTVYPL